MRKLALVGVLTALVAVPFLFADADEGPARRHIRLSESSRTPFSDAVLVGDALYLSGRLGIDPQTGAVPDDAGEEIRYLLDGFEAVLQQAGMTMDDLVSVQVFCSDLSLYDTFNAAYRTRFTGNYPARAFIGSGSLLRGARFEMQGVAVRRP